MRSRLTVTVFALLSVCLLGFTPLEYGALYYVTPHGLDSSAGTQASPWRTIQHAADVMVPGDTLIVLPGVYIESVDIWRSGTVEKYITYQAMPGAVMESPDPGQSFEALDIWPGVSYIRLTGFELRGGFHETIFVRQNSHHIEILDCDIHHNRTGVWWYGSSYGLLAGCRIYNNQSGGVGFSYGAHDILVRDTESSDHNDGWGCSGDADGFSADESAYNLTFERATASGNSEDGFDLKADNVVIDRSVSDNNNCVGVKLWSTATLRNSLVYGNPTGVKVTSIVSGGGTHVRLVNNTIADNDLGVALGGSRDHPYSVELFNNIVSGEGRALDFLDCVGLTENFNIFHRPVALAAHIVERIGCVSTSNAFRFSGVSINSGMWSAHSGQGANSRAADPRYVNPLAADFRPQLSSPAIDTGWSAVAPRTDLEGTARPQGNGFDIGAYEASVVGTAPSE
jgi:parallel beta-helix repeat protein